MVPDCMFEVRMYTFRRMTRHNSLHFPTIYMFWPIKSTHVKVNGQSLNNVLDHGSLFRQNNVLDPQSIINLIVQMGAIYSTPLVVQALRTDAIKDIVLSGTAQTMLHQDVFYTHPLFSTAFSAYSTWKTRPSGENCEADKSY